jgi:hypothetical protein
MESGGNGQNGRNAPDRVARESWKAIGNAIIPSKALFTFKI